MNDTKQQECFDILMYNLTWLRKTHGISKKRMATMLNIGIGSLNRIECGEFPPNLKVDVLLLACKHFHTCPNVLMNQKLNENL